MATARLACAEIHRHGRSIRDLLRHYRTRRRQLPRPPDKQEVSEVLPSLLRVLDAQRRVPIEPAAGFGGWDRNGVAEHSSWQDALLAEPRDHVSPDGNTSFRNGQTASVRSTRASTSAIILTRAPVHHVQLTSRLMSAPVAARARRCASGPGACSRRPVHRSPRRQTVGRVPRIQSGLWPDWSQPVMMKSWFCRVRCRWRDSSTSFIRQRGLP
jgi:hypothetical protein